MRWNDSITLLSAPESYQDLRGAWHSGERTGRTIFCNPYLLGTLQMAHLRSSDVRANNTTDPVDVGLRNEHSVQIKAIDYCGEDQAIYHGEEYEVMYIAGTGENIILTIGQRISNSAVSDG